MPLLRILNRLRRDERGAGEIGFAAFCVLCVFLLILGIGLFAATTYEGTPPDKIGLHYTGGPIDGTKFVSIVQPGQGKKILGLNEHMYLIPGTTRTYVVSKNAGEGDRAGADAIDAPSKDRVSFTYEAAIYFTVNADRTLHKVGDKKMTTLQQFFEEVCLHDKCYTDDGWKAMLEQFFRKPLELAIAQEAKQFDSGPLYSDPKVLAEMNRSISKSLANDINDNIGIDNVFCGPNQSAGKTCGDFKVIIKSPTPPADVVQAYNATKASAQAVLTAGQEAASAKAKAKGQADAARQAAEGDRDAQDTRASAKTLSPAQLAYLNAQALLACANNQNCTLVVTPSDTNVQVNAG